MESQHHENPTALIFDPVFSNDLLVSVALNLKLIHPFLSNFFLAAPCASIQNRLIIYSYFSRGLNDITCKGSYTRIYNTTLSFPPCTLDLDRKNADGGRTIQGAFFTPVKLFRLGGCVQHETDDV